MLLFLITLRKIILKAGDLEHRCVRCKGSHPQRHSNWLKETPLNGAAEYPAFVHLFVSSLPCDSLFNFWSLARLYFIRTCIFFFYWNCTRRELVTLRIRVTFRKLGFLFCFEQTIQVLTRGFAIVKVSTYWRGFLNVSSLGLEAKKKERNDSNVI